MERLTDDLLVLFFSQFKPVELARRLELVCKRWNRLIRSTPCLWNDGVLIKKDKTVKELNRKTLDALLKRSKEHLRSLAVCVGRDFECSKSDFDWIIRRLPKLGLEELSIEIGPCLTQCHLHSRMRHEEMVFDVCRHDMQRFPFDLEHDARIWNTSSRRSKHLSGHDLRCRWPKLLQSITKCPHLHFLQIEGSGIPIENGDFIGLRSLRHLHHLVVYMLYAKDLLLGFARAGALDTIKHLTQAECLPCRSQHVANDSEICQILNPCQESLEKLEMSVQWSEVGNTNSAESDLTVSSLRFPNMQTLLLRSPLTSCDQATLSSSTLFSKVRWECPQVTKLAIDVPIPHEIANDLITANLEHLHIFMRQDRATTRTSATEAEQESSRLGARVLSRCTKLKTIVLQCNPYATSKSVIQALCRFNHIPIVSVTVINDNHVQASLLEKLVLSRLQSSVAVPLVRLHVEGCGEVDSAALKLGDEDAETRCCTRLFELMPGFSVSPTCGSHRNVELVHSSRGFFGAKRRRLV